MKTVIALLCPLLGHVAATRSLSSSGDYLDQVVTKTIYNTHYVAADYGSLKRHGAKTHGQTDDTRHWEPNEASLPSEAGLHRRQIQGTTQTSRWRHEPTIPQRAPSGVPPSPPIYSQNPAHLDPRHDVDSSPHQPTRTLLASPVSSLIMGYSHPQQGSPVIYYLRVAIGNVTIKVPIKERVAQSFCKVVEENSRQNPGKSITVSKRPQKTEKSLTSAKDKTNNSTGIPHEATSSWGRRSSNNDATHRPSNTKSSVKPGTPSLNPRLSSSIDQQSESSSRKEGTTTQSIPTKGFIWPTQGGQTKGSGETSRPRTTTVHSQSMPEFSFGVPTSKKISTSANLRPGEFFPFQVTTVGPVTFTCLGETCDRLRDIYIASGVPVTYLVGSMDLAVQTGFANAAVRQVDLPMWKGIWKRRYVDMSDFEEGELQAISGEQIHGEGSSDNKDNLEDVILTEKIISQLLEQQQPQKTDTGNESNSKLPAHGHNPGTPQDEEPSSKPFPSRPSASWPNPTGDPFDDPSWTNNPSLNPSKHPKASSSSSSASSDDDWPPGEDWSTEDWPPKPTTSHTPIGEPPTSPSPSPTSDSPQESPTYLDPSDPWWTSNDLDSPLPTFSPGPTIVLPPDYSGPFPPTGPISTSTDPFYWEPECALTSRATATGQDGRTVEGVVTTGWGCWTWDNSAPPATTTAVGTMPGATSATSGAGRKGVIQGTDKGVWWVGAVVGGLYVAVGFWELWRNVLGRMRVSVLQALWDRVVVGVRFEDVFRDPLEGLLAKDKVA
ncbi:hypothetical protein BS50DRAFT_585334 [Corynespora cassiicola Philippines]|uniref:Uncharacterized protein n=1 Tax=Corynespora cassiicola Philippines TaxID=1448308 RepID=A0A2T2NWN3_CORCC|nr:hypothetical protein BS50DRAFT_585334 [Corynespora cassiicola Philippines]